MVKYLILFSVTLVASGVSFAQTVSPLEVISTMESGGVHPGFRRNHAKGLCFEGSFKGTKEAAELSSSNLFSGPAVPFIGRFSNPGPNPEVADNAPMPRGMALQFRPRKGDVSNMSMLDVPVFSSSTPESFNELLKAKTPEQIAAFKKKNPSSAGFFAFLADHGVPQSYSTADYHSLHAFKLSNKKNQSQFVRWNFISQQGNHFLTAAEAKMKSPKYLSETLVEELKKGPLQWKMMAVLAKDGDSLTDPTKQWTGEHKAVELGTLTVTKTSGNGMAACDLINYDPNNLAAGIAPSDDPVLKFRSPAYALSFGKRSGEKAQGQK